MDEVVARQRVDQIGDVGAAARIVRGEGSGCRADCRGDRILSAEVHRDLADIAKCRPVDAERARDAARHFRDAHAQADLDLRVHLQAVVHALAFREVGGGRGRGGMGVGRRGHAPLQHQAFRLRLDPDIRPRHGAVDRRRGLAGAEAGRADRDLEQPDGLAGGIERRHRGVSGGDTEQEQAGGTGRAHLGDLRVRDKHVGDRSGQRHHAAGARLDDEPDFRRCRLCRCLRRRLAWRRRFGGGQQQCGDAERDDDGTHQKWYSCPSAEPR
jgi:hypothetical protein